MIIHVHAKPGARRERVERTGDDHYKVWVRAVAEKGRANEAVIEALSGYLSLSRARFEILTGRRSGRKTIRIT